MKNFYNSIPKFFNQIANSKKVISLIFAFITIQLKAQTISGKVLSDQNEPLINSNVFLLNETDSSLVKVAITNLEGIFLMESVETGKYVLSISYIGFETYTKGLFITKTNSDLGSIALKPSSNLLDQVTVVARKPFAEQKIDRLVINVKNSITSSGSTVLAILQKSPGITVNQQAGIINMAGKEGVQVMINGKLSYMPAAAIVPMLEGMSSNNVERIELITTPPSKFDAGGNAGYINIVLSENPNKGFNGSYSLTAAGFNGSAPSANADFNYRKNKINLYGSYSYSRIAQLQYIQNYRNILYENTSKATVINSRRDPVRSINNLRIGVDYQLGKRTTMGLLISAYENLWKMSAFNTSILSVNKKEDSRITIDNKNINSWKHGMINFNIQHTLKYNGDLNFNMDFLKYDNYNPSKFVNKYSKNGTFIKEEYIGSSKKTLIDIFPIQLDYSKKLNTKTAFEIGVKTVISRFSNDVLVEQLIQNVWKPDQEFTANYKLIENVAAAYTSFTINANPKNTIKAGLRYEYTKSNLGSDKQANIVDRKYGYLFPTMYWSHKINESKTINMSYNRRINRPAFNDLAPFLTFADPNTFISGNSALQPAIANNASVSYALKMYNFSLNYSHENFTIGAFQFKIDPVTNKQYNTAENLKFTESLFATFAIPMKFTNWWKSQLNINSSWIHAVADYIKPETSIKIFNYNLSGFHNFTLSKNINMELSGFYQSKGLFGIAVLKPLGQLNFGTQFKFPKSNSNLKLGVDDIFSTMKYNFENNSDILGYQAYMNLNMQRRLFKITFSQNLGNKKLKEKRNRNTASDAERKRVSN